MMTFMFTVTALLFLALLIVTGVKPRRSGLSAYQRQQRASQAGVGRVVLDLRREQLLPDVVSLQRALSALLLVVVVVLSVHLFGWLLGVMIAVVVAIEYGAIARIPLLQRQSQKLYDRFEATILDFIAKGETFFRFIRSGMPDLDVETTIDSRDELEHVIAQTKSVLSPDEKSLLLHSLQFGSRLVREVMTPRGVVDSIAQSEFLGPLVLDDLHKTGHSRFPVTDGDIDHIVGMLYVQNLLSLDVKKSVTVEKAMEPRVFYIHQDQTLQHALAAFLRTHHLLFVVVNDYRETVGLLSLEDIIEALIGRKINDEFDTHEDLRIVASRNPRGNNPAKKGQDV